MPPTPELLQLQTTDDPASVRDHLSFARGKNVLLIWPEKGTALTRKLDLVLIQREAARLAIRLALVTHDSEVTRHAHELGISVFETVGSAQRAKWRRTRGTSGGRTLTSRIQRPDNEPHAEDLRPLVSRLREAPVRRRGGIVRLITLVILLAIIGGVAYVVAPSATITLTPTRVESRAETTIIADPAYTAAGIVQTSDVDAQDAQNRTIPALTLRVEVEERASVETTGTRSLGASPALGSVVFINTTAQPVDIPQGTFVSTSAGTPIIFRTTQPAQAPGGEGQQIEVSIEAVPESAGVIGNDLGVGIINTILGNLGERLQVRNFAPTYGGTSSTIRVVTDADQQFLLDTLRQQIQARAYTEMLPRITETQFIIPETIRIVEERDDWTRYERTIGDMSDTASLTMRATVEATAVELQFAQQIAYVELSNQIPRGRVIDVASLTYARGAEVQVDSSGRVTFTMSASGLVGAQINAAQLQERLAGRSREEAARYLTSTLDLGDTPPQVTISPDWLGHLPLLPMRIEIVQVQPSVPEVAP